MAGAWVGLQAGSAARVTQETPMYVETILRKKGDTVVTVKPDYRVADAAQILHDNRIGAALVTNAAGKVVGILSERDIVRGVARHREACLDMRVDELMTSPVAQGLKIAGTDRGTMLDFEGHASKVPFDNQIDFRAAARSVIRIFMGRSHCVQLAENLLDGHPFPRRAHLGMA
jgi:hypothetical protein